MVAIIELVSLIVCLLLGVWWVSQTSRFRSRKRSGQVPQHVDGRLDTKVDPPNHGFDPGTGGSW
jgi:hypothetical protein